MQLNLI